MGFWERLGISETEPHKLTALIGMLIGRQVKVVLTVVVAVYTLKVMGVLE